MSWTQQDVEKIALLARLHFSAEELDGMTRQLGTIVGYVRQLADLDTEEVEPMAHACDWQNVFRADEPQPSLPSELALRESPRHDEGFFLVPPVL